MITAVICIYCGMENCLMISQKCFFPHSRTTFPARYAAAQREKRPITRGQMRPGGGQHPSHPSPAEFPGARPGQAYCLRLYT